MMRTLSEPGGVNVIKTGPRQFLISSGDDHFIQDWISYRLDTEKTQPTKLRLTGVTSHIGGRSGELEIK